ncbi:DUF3105 domain-containing protein [Streptomyces sp. YIM 98790]|uniref:DUF3105 domain-containing protein n=1 Tax=Streptomyces sp. YIM 98790 TaxID=2689077 RepID=UPI00140BDCF8|nr:DUF3105 domain-containing protein [Streptomyces sp. YIM 98790]
MSSANRKAQAAERRARIEAMRRADQARERRSKIITWGAVAVISAATLGGGWYLWYSTEQDEQAAAAARKATVEGVETWADLSQTHTTEPVDYAMSPAAGGDHHPAWLACDAKVYEEEVSEEQAVHSLEHGAVWITYNDQAADGDIKALTDRVAATPYTFLSPYADQEDPVVLTAWGHQLAVDDADDPRVEQFLLKYVQGEQTPEPGATCASGSMP